MNEDAPDKPVAAEQPVVEQRESTALLETAQGFTIDESLGYQEAIESRAPEEATRPGLMKRLIHSGKARMAMTVLAGALALGEAPAAQAAERKQKEPGSGRTGRAAIAAVLEGAQRKLSGGRWEDAVRGGVGAGMEQYGREKIAQEERRAQRAQVEAHEAERVMRNAEYKLRRIEAELPRLERQIKVAQYSALKLAATDEGAKQVRAIMMERTGVKIDLWKASYEGDEARVEELARRDRELEESLLPHLGGRVAQRTGDLFVNTIMSGELKMLDLEGQKGHLQDAMGSAGEAMQDAMGRWEAHAERAQRAHDLATVGVRIGRY